MRHLLSLILSLSTLAFAQQPVKCPQISHVSISRGEYSPRPGVSFDLLDYAATMVPSSESMPTCMVKINEVEHGQVFASMGALTKVFNTEVSKGQKHTITGIHVRADGRNIAISGTAHKGVPIPFTIKGPIEVVNGELLSLRAMKIDAAGVPIKWLLNAVGLELGNMVGAGSKGVTVQGDLLLFQLDKLAHMKGHISSARVLNDGLQIDFAPVAPAVSANQRR